MMTTSSKLQQDAMRTPLGNREHVTKTEGAQVLHWDVSILLEQLAVNNKALEPHAQMLCQSHRLMCPGACPTLVTWAQQRAVLLSALFR